MPVTFRSSREQFIAKTASPGLGWKLYIGLPNTDTKNNMITIYSDEGLTNTITNPVVFNEEGRGETLIYIDDALFPTYSYVLDDELDQQELDEQEVQSIPGGNVFTNAIFVPDVSTTTVPGVAGVDYTIDTFPSPLVLNNVYKFRAHVSNTGAFNINSTNVKLQDTLDPYMSALLVDGIYELLFDGTNLILQNPDLADITDYLKGHWYMFAKSAGSFPIALTGNGGSIGPTGSGAGQIVASLDALPIVKAFKIDVIIESNTGDVGDTFSRVQVHSGFQGAASGESTSERIAISELTSESGSALQDVIRLTPGCVVSTSTANVFNMTWNDNTFPINPTISFKVTGFLL